MPDDRTPGQVLHEARIAGGEARPRPWPPEDWADRDPRLKELDEAMAAAVAAEVCSRIARKCEERGNALVPSDERNAWLSAAAVARAAAGTEPG